MVLSKYKGVVVKESAPFDCLACPAELSVEFGCIGDCEPTDHLLVREVDLFAEERCLIVLSARCNIGCGNGF